jgi:hypothetical protein
MTPGPVQPFAIPGGRALLAVGAALVVVGVGVGAAFWRRGQTGPEGVRSVPGEVSPGPAAVVPAASEKKAPTGPPSETWTHAELLAHWRKHGLALEARETDYASLYGSAQFVSDRGPVSEGEAATLTKSKLPAGYAFVQRRKTAEEADEACRKTKGPCFAWGRFYVTGDSGLVERLRRSLP